MTLTKSVPLALALSLACAAAWADTLVIDANGARRTIKGVTTPDGKEVPASVIFDPPAGVPYGLTHGFFVAPAISVGTVVHRSATVTAAGSAVAAMPANSGRRAGYCQASLSNAGTVAISTTGTPVLAPNVANDAELSPGQSFDVDHNGVVDQGAVNVTSTAANDIVTCQEVN